MGCKSFDQVREVYLLGKRMLGEILSGILTDALTNISLLVALKLWSSLIQHHQNWFLDI